MPATLDTTTRDNLLAALDGAPLTPGRIAANLRGWWTPDGWYVCASCAGRIVARGCSLPRGSDPVWADRPEPFGDCCCCQ